MVDRAGAEEIAHRDFHQLDDVLLLHLGIVQELLARAVEHVEIHLA